MSSCVVTANTDDIIMFPIPFITLLFFPYITPKTENQLMFQSFAFKSIFDKVMSPQTVLSKKFSYFFKIMHNFSSCSRVNVQGIAQFF